MNKAKWENWTNLILGIWLFITPWVVANNLDGGGANVRWNFWIVGAVVAVSAGLALRDLKPWEEWVNLALGAWMILSPWLFGYTSERGLTWNSLIVGVAVVVLSGISIPIAQKLQHQK